MELSLGFPHVLHKFRAQSDTNLRVSDCHVTTGDSCWRPQYVNVLGRNIFLYDCDVFTRDRNGRGSREHMGLSENVGLIFPMK